MPNIKVGREVGGKAIENSQATEIDKSRAGRATTLGRYEGATLKAKSVAEQGP